MEPWRLTSGRRFTSLWWVSGSELKWTRRIQIRIRMNINVMRISNPAGNRRTNTHSQEYEDHKKRPGIIMLVVLPDNCGTVWQAVHQVGRRLRTGTSDQRPATAGFSQRTSWVCPASQTLSRHVTHAPKYLLFLYTCLVWHAVGEEMTATL